MKAVEWRICLDENEPIVAFINRLEQPPERCVSIAQDSKNFGSARRTVIDVFKHSPRFAPPAHAGVDSCKLDLVSAPRVGGHGLGLFVLSDGIGMPAHLIVDIAPQD